MRKKKSALTVLEGEKYVQVGKVKVVEPSPTSAPGKLDIQETTLPVEVGPSITSPIGPMSEQETRYQFNLQTEWRQLQTTLRFKTQRWLESDHLSMKQIRQMSWTAQNLLVEIPLDFPLGLCCATYNQEANELNHRIWAYLLTLKRKRIPLLTFPPGVLHPLLISTSRRVDKLTQLENKILLYKYLLNLKGGDKE